MQKYIFLNVNLFYLHMLKESNIKGTEFTSQAAVFALTTIFISDSRNILTAVSLSFVVQFVTCDLQISFKELPLEEKHELKIII